MADFAVRGFPLPLSPPPSPRHGLAYERATRLDFGPTAYFPFRSQGGMSKSSATDFGANPFFQGRGRKRPGAIFLFLCEKKRPVRSLYPFPKKKGVINDHRPSLFPMGN